MKVRWNGVTGAVCREVGAETGLGDVLEHDAVYEVSDELAEQLLASGANWAPADDSVRSQLLTLKREDLERLASDAGIENPKAFKTKPALVDALIEAAKEQPDA